MSEPRLSKVTKKLSLCPLDTNMKLFSVWDGYGFIKDETVRMHCTVDRIDTVLEGCCETIRVASSRVDSVSMQSQRNRMGTYKAVGKMNNMLVYEQINPRSQVNYAYTWQDKLGLIRW